MPQEFPQDFQVTENLENLAVSAVWQFMRKLLSWFEDLLLLSYWYYLWGQSSKTSKAYLWGQSSKTWHILQISYKLEQRIKISDFWLWKKYLFRYLFHYQKSLIYIRAPANCDQIFILIIPHSKATIQRNHNFNNNDNNKNNNNNKDTIYPVWMSIRINCCSGREWLKFIIDNIKCNNKCWCNNKCCI